MRVKAVSNDIMEIILRLLTPQNEVACRLALEHGLRIGDVLRLRNTDLEKTSHTFKEEKTGKRRKITWSEADRRMCSAISGRTYIFEHRLDRNRHRTRQAVYKDIQRARSALRIKEPIGTHSMRKTYSVRKYKACGDMRKVQALLCHSDEAVTMLYALAEEVQGRKIM